ncbi:PWWP domain [Cinara cedri]|uniref:PWWP domain n=1 Tax=Cinara cedri TaxID=506608 RepID=A0A5E4MLA4_9HEMI|nr:PWWP domain [Cinara cedri]
MDVQHVQAVNNADTMESKSEYEVGDIVWAKLMGCPFWPAIVTYDPVSRLYTKGEKKTFALHVRFCGYYGQRNWAKIIEQYNSKEDFVSKHPDCMVFLKKKKKEMVRWQAGVQEADHLMTLVRKERMLHFCSMYELDYSKELGINSSSDDLAPQNSNLNPSEDLHDASLILTINNENIQNNDTTDTTDHDVADSKTISEQIANLLIDKYGYSQNDAEHEIKEEELDFDSLEPWEEGTSLIPEDLKTRISEYERIQELKQKKKKKMNSRRL